MKLYVCLVLALSCAVISAFNNPCMTSGETCGKQGYCIPQSDGSSVCLCKHGSFGDFCEKQSSVAASRSACMAPSNKCKGQCIPQSGNTTKCICLPGMTGVNCDQEIPEYRNMCKKTPSPCGDGICLSLASGEYFCH